MFKNVFKTSSGTLEWRFSLSPKCFRNVDSTTTCRQAGSPTYFVVHETLQVGIEQFLLCKPWSLRRKKNFNFYEIQRGHFDLHLALILWYGYIQYTNNITVLMAPPLVEKFQTGHVHSHAILSLIRLSETNCNSCNSYATAFTKISMHFTLLLNLFREENSYFSTR